MTELLHTLFHPLSNAIMSGFMIVVLLYWIASFLGIGLGDFDFDFGFDAHAGAVADVAADTEINASDSSDVDTSDPHHQGDSLFVRFLKFMNVGKVPFMLVLSTLKFFTWAGSLFTTQLIDMSNWGWKSVLILIPCSLVGVFLTRYATRPIASFLAKTGYQGEESIEFLGRTGTMFSTIQGNKIGNAEFLIEKNPIKLNVVSQSGEEIKYGESVLISDESGDKKIFYVTKEITLDQN